MNRRAALPGDRMPQAPVRSLLALALMAVVFSATAQERTPASDGQAAPWTSSAEPPAGAVQLAAPAGTGDELVANAPDPLDATPADTGAEARSTDRAPVAAAASDPQATGADATATAAATRAETTAPTPATGAEADYDALYGTSGATGSGALPGAYDPWEPYNRRMHRFNNAVDRRVALPLARTYVKVVPRPLRTGISNFFSNLGQPLTAVNSLLQGKPKQAAHSLGRFVMNSTLGVGGVFDPATDARLRNGNEDFGQTLGVWGWKRSRYVELPLFGPRTLRDVVGMGADAPLSPLRRVKSDAVRAPLQGLQLVDMRMQLMSTDALREGVEDDYRLVRDAWMQRRAYQIDGDRMGDDAVPDYLKDAPLVVPVDAMPVSGG